MFSKLLIVMMVVVAVMTRDITMPQYARVLGAKESDEFGFCSAIGDVNGEYLVALSVVQGPVVFYST